MIALAVSVVDLALVASIVFVAAMVQVLSGFGFGLMTVPLMSLVITTREAVVVSTLLGVGLSSWQAWHQRADAVRPLVVRMTAAAYVGMPFGLWVFVAVDDHTLRLLLGISVLASVVLLARRINLHHVGPTLDVTAGFLSGVLNTSLSTNGPPLVFVLQARQLEPPAFRGTISQVFAWSNVVGLTLFVVAGKVTSGGPPRRRCRPPCADRRAVHRLPAPSPRARRTVPVARAGAADRSGAQRDHAARSASERRSATAQGVALRTWW